MLPGLRPAHPDPARPAHVDRDLGVPRTAGFPPRRFINTRIRVTEETWACAECLKAKEVGGAAVGLVVDFEHVGTQRRS